MWKSILETFLFFFFFFRERKEEREKLSWLNQKEIQYKTRYINGSGKFRRQLEEKQFFSTNRAETYQ